MDQLNKAKALPMTSIFILLFLISVPILPPLIGTICGSIYDRIHPSDALDIDTIREQLMARQATASTA